MEELGYNQCRIAQDPLIRGNRQETGRVRGARRGREFVADVPEISLLMSSVLLLAERLTFNPFLSSLAACCSCAAEE